MPTLVSNPLYISLHNRDLPGLEPGGAVVRAPLCGFIVIKEIL
ncbi:MAG: hypothetical protein ACNJA3_09390 [Pseudomonas rhizophila]|jgi:hypothetical protein|nr:MULTISPECIES: hypothetical protein [Pseudomonas]MEA1031962.1 hypothetical protein [Pseudomonas sp. N-137]